MATEYIYSEKISEKFVFELAKIGRVRVLSNQVTIEGKSIELERVHIPGNAIVEWAGISENGYASVTFRFD